MSRGLFITGTGTDVGKTYVTALIVKKLHQAGLRAGYYKAALSGAGCIADSDAGYVKQISGISQPEKSMVSYLYRDAVSPHLAARREGNPVMLSKVKKDYEKVCERYDYVTVEGSGGIVCPIRWDDREQILLEDVVKELKLAALLVADAGLGAIHAAVTTAEYMWNRGLTVKGIVLNHYTGDGMQRDNLQMIEALLGIPVIACVGNAAEELLIDVEELEGLYG
ncbi:MAG: dethiobiotin synthase [Dorea sp.]|nr:dethiobiotin synthase [Dorea sp.]